MHFTMHCSTMPNRKFPTLFQNSFGNKVLNLQHSNNYTLVTIFLTIDRMYLWTSWATWTVPWHCPRVCFTTEVTAYRTRNADADRRHCLESGLGASIKAGLVMNRVSVVFKHRKHGPSVNTHDTCQIASFPFRGCWLCTIRASQITFKIL